jgi:hypothetical protein
MARKTDELFRAYRALVDEHLAMRKQIGAAMRTFEREFRACRPEDEAALAAKFRAILDCLKAGVADRTSF